MLGSPRHSRPPSRATKTKTTKKKFTQSPPQTTSCHFCHFFFALPSKSRCWDDASLAKLEVHDYDTSDLRRPRGRRKNPEDRVLRTNGFHLNPGKMAGGAPGVFVGERSSKELFQLLFFGVFGYLGYVLSEKKTCVVA